MFLNQKLIIDGNRKNETLSLLFCCFKARNIPETTEKCSEYNPQWISCDFRPGGDAKGTRLTLGLHGDLMVGVGGLIRTKSGQHISHLCLLKNCGSSGHNSENKT